MPHSKSHSDTPISVHDLSELPLDENEILEGDRHAPKNFSIHQSRLGEEGRRNKPKNASPKKLKKEHAKENIKEAALRRTAGVLRPFYSESEEKLDLKY